MTKMKQIKIATRKSPLALWQAEFIRAKLMRLHPQLDVELLPMSTQGDKVLDSPLAKIGGKGLFVKELEVAMLDKRADLAVHSTKDVPMMLPDDLCLGVICQRDNPLDALVFPAGSPLSQLGDLPVGARVGTSSLRRQCQLLASRPDIQCIDLRGNVNTRLAKLDEGQYDAIILAASGLERLGLQARVSSLLPPELMLPAVAQGALSIEYRRDDQQMHDLLSPLHHSETALCVAAERAMNQRLNGGCQVPIAGYATMNDDHIHLRALVGALPSSQQAPQLLMAAATGADAKQVGVTVAEELLAQGAASLLAATGVVVDD